MVALRCFTTAWRDTGYPVAKAEALSGPSLDS